MQKIIGFGMILAGCTGLGVWYSTQFQLQLRNLQEMCRILEILLGQIRYGRCTLPECCHQLAKKANEPYRSCFSSIYEAACLNHGESFGQICKKNLEKNLQKLVVDKADKELFISCFTQGGFDEDMLQMCMIEQTKVELEGRLQALSKENTSKCRLALSLGAMSGLLLVILFL